MVDGTAHKSSVGNSLYSHCERILGKNGRGSGTEEVIRILHGSYAVTQEPRERGNAALCGNC
jgi:hypothetical protein